MSTGNVLVKSVAGTLQTNLQYLECAAPPQLTAETSYYIRVGYSPTEFATNTAIDASKTKIFSHYTNNFFITLVSSTVVDATDPFSLTYDAVISLNITSALSGSRSC